MRAARADAAGAAAAAVPCRRAERSDDVRQETPGEKVRADAAAELASGGGGPPTKSWAARRRCARGWRRRS